MIPNPLEGLEILVPKTQVSAKWFLGVMDMLRTMLVDMAVADGLIDISELKVLTDTFLRVGFSSNGSKNHSHR